MELGLDIVAGCRVAMDEMYGDWYRDPWGWPEFRWTSQNPGAVRIVDLLRRTSDGYSLATPASFHLIEVPKNRLAVRPAVVQDSASRLLYATAVASNIRQLHSHLPSWAFGWRTRDGRLFAKNRTEWASYIKLLAEAPAWMAGLHVDIAACFASIDVERLADLVHQRLKKTAASGVISDVIRRHDSLTTRSGIPQRSFASAALAHLYLQPIDDALSSANAGDGVPLVARWMDDVTAIGDEEHLYSLYLDLQDRAQQIGLGLNAAKSRLVDAGDIVESIRADELKEIPVDERTIEGYGGPTTVWDTTELLKIEEMILEKPANVPRSLLRATLNSLSKCLAFDRWSDWLDAAHKVPHVADTLGRYLRKGAESLEVDSLVQSQRWEELEAWLLDFASRPWGRVDWVTAQLALSFPATKQRQGTLDLMRRWLQTSDNVQKVAVAAQRLALRHPIDCRDIIRSRIDRISDPVLLRVLGLGLLMAGDDRRLVRDVIDRDPRNCLVRAMLEAMDWNCPAVTPDFDQD